MPTEAVVSTVLSERAVLRVISTGITAVLLADLSKSPSVSMLAVGL